MLPQVQQFAQEDEDAEAGLISWKKLREKGRHMVWDGDRRYIDAQVVNTDLAAIIFTSGTTGVAKGVMLSHRNLMLDTMLVQSMFEARPKDICFSVLPMHHCYECTATFLSCVYSGATVAFCRGLKYIRKDILEVKPTILLAVPAIIENFHNKIRRSVADKLSPKQMKAFEIMDREASRLKVKLPKKVTKDIEAVFGGRMHTIISGGAPIDGAILDSFCNIGFNAIQGYGLSECAPIVALNPAKRKYMKNASAGHVMPFTECKILDPDSNGIGEICFRGPQVMMGYYKDPENTAAVLDEEGWFHTGDMGFIDKNGCYGERQGTILLPGEELLGAFCKVYMKDRRVPEYVTVSFDEAKRTKENGELQATWKSQPVWMCVKVAEARCLKAAIPEFFAGTFAAEELGMEETGAVAAPVDMKTVQDAEFVPVDENTGEVQDQESFAEAFFDQEG